MDKEKEDIIFGDFPDLFPTGREPSPDTLMYYGFACRNGWYKHVYNLCYDVKKIAKRDNLTIVVEQVKEKFGGLRFYCRGANQAVHNIIREYETESVKICEVCGTPGEYRNDLSWIQTLCDQHDRETREQKRHNYIAKWNSMRGRKIA